VISCELTSDSPWIHELSNLLAVRPKFGNKISVARENLHAVIVLIHDNCEMSRDKVSNYASRYVGNLTNSILRIDSQASWQIKLSIAISFAAKLEFECAVGVKDLR
jgi:hypothetical protein